MSSVNTLLSQRLKKKEKSSKMTKMAKQSATGNLTSFSGIFGAVELSSNEKDLLEAILHEYGTGSENLAGDLRTLISITSEVKAINNQAAILHGERIKKAHQVLTKYHDGAFTTWLMAAYGNRQTPYNFMQYYEFYQAMPKTLRPQVELMPRQAVYTLATRDGSLDQKRKIVEEYNGETKGELLTLIREQFPLSDQDKRAQNYGESTLQTVSRLCSSIRRAHRPTISRRQKKAIYDLLEELRDLVEECRTR